MMRFGLTTAFLFSVLLRNSPDRMPSKG